MNMIRLKWWHTQAGYLPVAILSLSLFHLKEIKYVSRQAGSKNLLDKKCISHRYARHSEVLILIINIKSNINVNFFMT